VSKKPSDIVEQLSQVVPLFVPGTPHPTWFPGSPSDWMTLLQAAAAEIKKNRQEMADLVVMKESYSRLYKQIYGND
jgi:hypothetical protein